MSSLLTLIDGNSLLFRAYYGLHSRLTRRDGTPVNAVYGFCNMILPLLSAAKPNDVFVCVFDAGRKNWRNDIYPEYKANRHEMPADLAAQIELTRDAAAALGMPVLAVENVEADDVIATLAGHRCAAGRTTRVVTGDKDLMQLVSHCCFLYDGLKEKEIREPDVLEKFGVRPAQVVDVQSLMGDSSDNVPGVPGVGPKTAMELIQEFGSLDGVYAHLDKIKNDRRRNLLREHKDKAYISKQLVSLKTDVKLPGFSEEPYRFDMDAAIEFARTQLESPALESKIRKMFGNLEHNPTTDGFAVGSPQGGSSRPMSQSATIPPLGGVDGKAVGGGTDNVVEKMGHHHKHFKLITSESELDEFLGTVGDVLAIDTETTGLDQMTARAVGISLAAAPNFGVYIPVKHKIKSENLFDDFDSKQKVSNLPIDTVKKKLWPYLKNHKILKVGHNLKYDLHILENEGWETDEISPIDDTMLLSYALHGASHGHGLDELAHLYLGHEMISFASLFPPRTKEADKNFAHLDMVKAAEYSAEDAYVTFALYELFRPQLDENNILKKLYESCDRPLLRILMHMERNGILVDQSQLQSLSDVFHAQLGVLQKEIWKLAGHEFNIGSPKQLGEVLFDKLKLPGGKNKSTDAGVLTEIADTHPVVSKILEWRSLSKLAGTYTDALPRQIAADGRIHTTYMQTSTNTGRLSSRDPNLQNIPIKTDLGAQIRKCFVAAPGNVLISIDYSQIQLRLMAHIANVSGLMESFLHGRDIHEDTARKIFDLSPHAHVTAAQRGIAKTTNFSIIYGVSPFGLAAQLDISRDDAKKIIDSYMAGFPEIKAYIEKTKEFATAHGFVMTPWGRRIELPDIKNPRLRAYALRAAINAPIQGAEADLVRLAMVRIADAISGVGSRESGVDNNESQIDGTELHKHHHLRFQTPDSRLPKMLLQVHDEIVMECPEHSAEHWAKKIKEIMESADKISVPIVADYSISKVWEK